MLFKIGTSGNPTETPIKSKKNKIHYCFSFKI